MILFFLQFLDIYSLSDSISNRSFKNINATLSIDSSSSLPDSNHPKSSSTCDTVSINSSQNNKTEFTHSSSINSDSRSIKSLNSSVDIVISKEKTSRSNSNSRQVQNGLTSITNGILNNSLSASASSLNKNFDTKSLNNCKLKKTNEKSKVKSNSYVSIGNLDDH